MESICFNSIENDFKIVKFDNINSKYNEYFVENFTILNSKVVNITDTEIINFYDIDILPTIYIYKNKNLLGTIEGFHTKTCLLKKINLLIN